MSKIKMIGNIVVNAFQIIGTNDLVFQANKPISSPFRTDGESEASTITTFTEHGVEGWYGRIGTDPDRELYKDFGIGTDERCHAVSEAYQKRYMAAYDAIHQALPFARNGNHIDGEVIVNANEVKLDDTWTDRIDGK